MSLRVTQLRGFSVSPIAAAVSAAPEAVDFNGVDNSIKKTSDFTGNADGKTFTCSFWIYVSDDSINNFIYDTNGSSVRVAVRSTDLVEILAENSSGTIILDMESSVKIPKETFTHILVSVDLANASNRSLHINDVEDAAVNYATYTNADINFTETAHTFGTLTAGGAFLFGRPTHVYLDYTFRDMTIESNRRIFNQISSTQGLIPVSEASLASLNSIFYFAFTDPNNMLNNQGTGGDANTIGGTFALSQRGPNQFNGNSVVCNTGTSLIIASGATGVASNKTLTLSMFFTNEDSASLQGIYFQGRQVSAGSTVVEIRATNTNSVIRIRAFNSAGTVILEADISTPQPTQGIHHNLQFTCDLTNASNRAVVMDKRDITSDVTFTTYTNDTIAHADIDEFGATGSASGGNDVNGVMGELFYTNEFISDLVDNNTFVDENSRSLYGGEDGSKFTGTQPPVYLRMNAINPGKNLGSETDFTEVGIFVGTRGGSEFWARSITTNAGTTANTFTNYLARSGLIGGSSTMGAFTLIQFAYNRDPTLGANVVAFSINDATASNSMGILAQVTENAEMRIGNVQEGNVTDGWIPENQWRQVFATRDGSNNTRFEIEATASTQASSITIDATGQVVIGSSSGDGDFRDTTGFLYFVDSFLDMSVKATVLKFIDGLGFPRDLTDAIIAGDIPVPLILMTYEDLDALGDNHALATGGNFTITGIILPGRDALPEFSA